MNAAASLSTISVKVPTKAANGIAAMGKAQGASQAVVAQALLMAAYSARVKPGDDPDLDAAVKAIDVDDHKESVKLRRDIEILAVNTDALEKKCGEQATRIAELEEALAEAVQIRPPEAAEPAKEGLKAALAENERLELDVIALKAIIDDAQTATIAAQSDAEAWRTEAKAKASELSILRGMEKDANDAKAAVAERGVKIQEYQQTIAGLKAEHEKLQKLHTSLVFVSDQRLTMIDELKRSEADLIAQALKRMAIDAKAKPQAPAAPHPCADVLIRLVALNDTASIAAVTDLAESAVTNMIAAWRESLRPRGGANNGHRVE